MLSCRSLACWQPRCSCATGLSNLSLRVTATVSYPKCSGDRSFGKTAAASADSGHAASVTPKELRKLSKSGALPGTSSKPPSSPPPSAPGSPPSSTLHYACNPDAPPLPPARPGTIEFDNVYLRYRPGAKCALDGVSLRIQHGETVGVVGRTGSGKSTLLLALFRVFELAVRSRSV